MRFAICDDQAVDRRRLQAMVQEYCLEHKLKIEVDLFPDGKQMLDCFTPGKYQVLFLDIYMPMMRGINVAKAIREQDTACQLVFVTVSADHALESYEVYAAGYLLKPYTKEDLTETLDWCLENISPMAQALEITFERERVQLILSDIQYIEVYGREAVIHTKSRVYSTNRSLTELERELPGDFLRCHRSYIVNMNFVSNMSASDFLLQDGMKVPIGAALRTKVKQNFSDWMFQKVRECF